MVMKGSSAGAVGAVGTDSWAATRATKRTAQARGRTNMMVSEWMDCRGWVGRVAVGAKSYDGAGRRRQI